MKSDELIDYQKLFSKIAVKAQEIEDIGSVASYIPELRNIDPNKFGILLTTINNQNYGLGDFNEKFSIQSISKVLALALAFELEDDDLCYICGLVSLPRETGGLITRGLYRNILSIVH
jgi:glutaminase